MSLLQRFTELQPSNKKSCPRVDICPDEMAFFAQSSSSTQFLSAPPVLSNMASMHHQHPRDDVDDFLSSDLELSFASTVSLNSPPRHTMSLITANEECEPMDISPAPPLKSVFTRPPAEVQAPKPLRPRAFTSAARTFGADLANRLTPSPSESKSNSISQQKRTQRAALPLEWMAVVKSSAPTKSTFVAVRIHSDQDWRRLLADPVEGF
jgi:M-phase inducer tyrosine phosphatase